MTVYARLVLRKLGFAPELRDYFSVEHSVLPKQDEEFTMLIRHPAISVIYTIALLFGSSWPNSGFGDDDIRVKNGTSVMTKTAAKSEELKTEERFDYKVRDDLFAGFDGDKEALQRGLETCEEALGENPRHAEALVWRGAVRVFKSRTAFMTGAPALGMKYWTTGLKDMDDAVDIAPDDIGVLIPRAAVLLPAGRAAPPSMGKPLLIKVRADLERTYERQKHILDELGEHPLGELRMGLADVYRLLGEPVKSNAQLKAVLKELPGTDYADRATDWLASAPDKKLAHSCIGCHSK
jgi:hypothetical protein